VKLMEKRLAAEMVSRMSVACGAGLPA
jgi:hypothetical protein